MKKHITLLFSFLILVGSLVAGSLSEGAPKLSIQKALELIQEKMEKEKLNELYFVDSVKYIDFNKSEVHWKARYMTEHTQLEPNTILPIHKYVVVYMDGETKLIEEEGIPRRRVPFANEVTHKHE